MGRRLAKRQTAGIIREPSSTATAASPSRPRVECEALAAPATCSARPPLPEAVLADLAGLRGAFMVITQR
jgi:hypothetical protein